MAKNDGSLYVGEWGNYGHYGQMGWLPTVFKSQDRYDSMLKLTFPKIEKKNKERVWKRGGRREKIGIGMRKDWDRDEKWLG